MKAGSILAIIVLAAPASAAAQAHGGSFGGGFGLAVGGFGHSGVASSFGHSGAHGSFAHGGFGHDGDHGHSHGRGFDHHHGFHDHGFAGWGWWGWPYWGWSDCYDASGCGTYEHASDDYGMTDAPAPPPCGGWAERAGRYVWSTGPCGPGADDPPPARYASSSANECSDWVWRADLHHSVCKRPSRAAG